MQPYGWRVVSINTISSLGTFIREELWLFHWRHYFFLLHVDNADRKGPQYEKAALEAEASKTEVTFVPVRNKHQVYKCYPITQTPVDLW